jgi:ligand-binding sensor protein
MKKELSEAARWFLEELERTLKEFALETKTQIAILDKKGDLVLEFSPNLKICQKIWGIPEGRIRCEDHFKIAHLITIKEKKPFIVKCFANFCSVWVPIIVENNVIGVIVNCGGKIKGESLEKLKNRIEKIAQEIGILEIESLKKEVEFFPELSIKEPERRIEKLKKLIEILAETTRTPLKEVFG